jgi:hypothetical protein
MKSALACVCRGVDVGVCVMSGGDDKDGVCELCSSGSKCYFCPLCR